jgi:hypothetical protein
MSNIFRILQQLVPQPPVLVGRVLAHHEDDTSTVELPMALGLTPYGGNVATGALIRPRGRTVPVGGMAFVRAGVIETQAPDVVPIDMQIGRIVVIPPTVVPPDEEFCGWVMTEVPVEGMTFGDTIGSGLAMSDGGAWLAIREQFTGPNMSTFNIFEEVSGGFDFHSTFDHTWVVTVANGTTHNRHYLSADGTMMLVVERAGSNLCQMFLYVRTGTSWAQTDSMGIAHWGSNPDVPYSPAFFGDGSAVVITGRGASFSGLRIVEVPIVAGVFGTAIVHDLSAGYDSATPFLTGAVSANADGSRITALVDATGFVPTLDSFVKVAGTYQYEANIHPGVGVAFLNAADDTKAFVGISSGSFTTSAPYSLSGGVWSSDGALDYAGIQQPIGAAAADQFYTYLRGATVFEWGRLYRWDYVCTTTPPVIPTYSIFTTIDATLMQSSTSVIADRDTERAAVAAGISTGPDGMAVDLTIPGTADRDFLIGTTGSPEYGIGRAAGLSKMGLLIDGTQAYTGLLLLEDNGKNTGWSSTGASPYSEWEYSYGTIRFDGVPEGATTYPFVAGTRLRVGCNIQFITNGSSITPWFRFYAQEVSSDGYDVSAIAGYPSILVNTQLSSLTMPAAAYDSSGTPRRGVEYVWDAATRRLEVWALDIVTHERVARIWPDAANPSDVAAVNANFDAYIPVNNPAVGYVRARSSCQGFTVLA